MINEVLGNFLLPPVGGTNLPKAGFGVARFLGYDGILYLVAPPFKGLWVTMSCDIIFWFCFGGSTDGLKDGTGGETGVLEMPSNVEVNCCGATEGLEPFFTYVVGGKLAFFFGFVIMNKFFV